MQISGQMLNRLHTEYILWAWPIPRILPCIIVFLILPPTKCPLTGFRILNRADKSLPICWRYNAVQLCFSCLSSRTVVQCLVWMIGNLIPAYAGASITISYRRAEVENLSLKKWRRDRDSNPRYRHRHAAFRVRCFRPLSHLSANH